MSKDTFFRALDPRVLAVAVINEGKNFGDWAAYIGAVPGNSHDVEKELVAMNGTKLDETIANYLFGGAIEQINNMRKEENLPPLRWRK